MSIQEWIIWAIIYFIGTAYVYCYGIAKALKEVRQKKGLISKNNEEVYYKDRKIFTWKTHLGSYIEMTFWTSIIVLGSVAIFYKGASLDFNDIPGVIISSIYALLSFNIFTDAPIDEEELEGKDSLLKWLVKQFGILKRFIVERVADKEYNKLKKKNINLIKKWCQNDKIKVASLVEKLNNKTFINMMPSCISDESKEELICSCKFIGEVFLDNYQDLYTELKTLFNQNLLELGVNICDITIYLHDHEEYKVEEKLDVINTRIGNKVKKKVPKRKKTVKVNNANDLDNIVETAIGTDE